MARGQNLLTKVFNKPLLITLEDLQPISDYLSNPERVASLKFENNQDVAPKLDNFNSEEAYKKAVLSHYDINPNTMTGLLNVDGVLVNREGQLNSQCVELTSYQGLKKRFELQVAQGMKSCVLMISSGGGEAFGAWSTASYIKKVAKQNDIKITAYVNGSACSAAYVWAAVADEVVSHPMGHIGSIGVLIQLYNDSKMLENMGVSRSFVYAGGNKIPFDESGEFSSTFIEGLQKDVNKTYSKFVSHVVENRPMTEEEVIATNASVFDAEEALTLKLIDKIQELEDFEIEYGLKTKTQATGSGMLLSTPPVHNKQEENMTDVTTDLSVEQLASDLATAKETLASTTEQLANSQEALQLKEADLTKLAEDKVELEKQLEDLQGAKEALETELANIKADALQAERKAKLESVLGSENDQVATLLTTTAGLEATAFDAIVSALEAKVEKEDKEMEELGNSNTQKATAPSFNDILAERMKAKNQ